MGQYINVRVWNCAFPACAVKIQLPFSTHGLFNGILELVPIHHRAPIFNILRTQYNTTCSLDDGQFLSRKKSLRGKYLALKSLDTRQSSFVWSFHPCLPSITILIEERSLNHIPLCILWHSLSQDIQQKPQFDEPPWPHQKAFSIFSISSIHVCGRRNMLMTWDGIYCITDLIINFIIYRHTKAHNSIKCLD